MTLNCRFNVHGIPALESFASNTRRSFTAVDLNRESGVAPQVGSATEPALKGSAVPGVTSLAGGSDRSGSGSDGDVGPDLAHRFILGETQHRETAEETAISGAPR